jgi:hypothetical protein
MLDGGYVITVEDVEGALKKQGDLKIEAGDVVIFHSQAVVVGCMGKTPRTQGPRPLALMNRWVTCGRCL